MTPMRPMLNVSITGVMPAMPVIGPKAESTEKESVVRLSDATVFAGAAETAANFTPEKSYGFWPWLFCL